MSVAKKPKERRFDLREYWPWYERNWPTASGGDSLPSATPPPFPLGKISKEQTLLPRDNGAWHRLSAWFWPCFWPSLSCGACSSPSSGQSLQIRKTANTRDRSSTQPSSRAAGYSVKHALATNLRSCVIDRASVGRPAFRTSVASRRASASRQSRQLVSARSFLSTALQRPSD